ncbi:hypothetical protein [Streptomyces formicae]|uniref:hypothetical protein n=1 Tax=Streptomyces formicae TaxID=1616117 RepID=UPI00131BEE31|nr:hypothetical protein [Streptomyces formicae]
MARRRSLASTGRRVALSGPCAPGTRPARWVWLLPAPPAHARWLAGTLPGARLAHIPGMGHLLHPAVTARLAGEILAHTAAASGAAR